jgi:hypothetical protein
LAVPDPGCEPHPLHPRKCIEYLLENLDKPQVELLPIQGSKSLPEHLKSTFAVHEPRSSKVKKLRESQNSAGK